MSSFVMAPESSRLITGTVEDPSGNPLRGVSVVVKETGNATVTDARGSFQLYIGPEARVLIFTCPGMQQQEVNIPKSSALRIVMKLMQLPKDKIIVEEREAETPYVIPAADQVAGRDLNRSHLYSGGALKTAQAHYAVSPEAGYIAHNTEGYSTIHENGFKDVLHNPLSTFSIDVDKASYSNVRRFLTY